MSKQQVEEAFALKNAFPFDEDTWEYRCEPTIGHEDGWEVHINEDLWVTDKASHKGYTLRRQAHAQTHTFHITLDLDENLARRPFAVDRGYLPGLVEELEGWLEDELKEYMERHWQLVATNKEAFLAWARAAVLEDYPDEAPPDNVVAFQDAKGGA